MNLQKLKIGESIIAASHDWDSSFLKNSIAGDRRYKYVPFHELSQQDQEQAKRQYPNKSTGAKYDFRDEHYFYPVDKKGKLASARRELAIPYEKIKNNEYMKKIGYTANPAWKEK
jgi:hypothetical protein